MLVVVVIVDVADSQSMVKTGHKGASGQVLGWYLTNGDRAMQLRCSKTRAPSAEVASSNLLINL